jgi:hypothetical protein
MGVHKRACTLTLLALGGEQGLVDDKGAIWGGCVGELKAVGHIHSPASLQA